MKIAKDDPEIADVLSGAEESMPYTVEQFRAEIQRLYRKNARVQNLVRLAHTLSTEAKVRKTLAEAMEVK